MNAKLNWVVFVRIVVVSFVLGHYAWNLCEC